MFQLKKVKTNLIFCEFGKFIYIYIFKLKKGKNNEFVWVYIYISDWKKQKQSIFLNASEFVKCISEFKEAQILNFAEFFEIHISIKKGNMFFEFCWICSIYV